MKRIITVITLFVIFSSCDSLVDNTDLSKRQTNSEGLLAGYESVVSSVKAADSISQFAWEIFQTRNGSNWNIRWNEQTGTPRTISNGLSRAYQEDNTVTETANVLVDMK